MEAAAGSAVEPITYLIGVAIGTNGVQKDSRTAIAPAQPEIAQAVMGASPLDGQWRQGWPMPVWAADGDIDAASATAIRPTDTGPRARANAATMSSSRCTAVETIPQA